MSKYSWVLETPRMMISLAENMAVYRIGKKRADVYHLRKDGFVQKDRKPFLWVYRGFEEDRRFSERRLTVKNSELRSQEIRNQESEFRSQNSE